MRKLGGSQPNLSCLAVATDISVSDDEDEFSKDDNAPKGLYPSLRQRVLSNPNLLDCDEPAKVCAEKLRSRPSRRFPST